jgi:putative FmdB family regulatory protein
MPIYTYQCAKCGADFEIIESMQNHATKKHRCPSCRSTRVGRVLAPPFVKTSRKS